MGERIVVDPPSRLYRAAAEWVVARFEEARVRGRFSLALAGGNTPRLLYQALSTELAHRVPWEGIEFYFGDERCVAPADPDSNFRMAEATLFQGHLVEEAQVHRIAGEAPDAAATAAAYDAQLPRSLDLLLLGVGRDGNIASLFPGDPAALERVRRVVAVEAPRAPTGRITITGPVIDSARAVLVVVSGPAKAEAVARALEGPIDVASCPAQLARRATSILDRAAASLLTER